MNENKMKAPSNADRVKAMSTDELAAFLVSVTARGGGLIAKADSYICHKCMTEHGGSCPINMDVDSCLYEMDELQTIKYWLEGETTE